MEGIMYHIIHISCVYIRFSHGTVTWSLWHPSRPQCAGKLHVCLCVCMPSGTECVCVHVLQRTCVYLSHAALCAQHPLPPVPSHTEGLSSTCPIGVQSGRASEQQFVGVCWWRGGSRKSHLTLNLLRGKVGHSRKDTRKVCAPHLQANFAELNF